MFHLLITPVLTVEFSMADKINAMVFLLVMLYGMGSWVAINGIWAELSLLVSILPESWGLPSLLVLIIQVSE